MNSKCPVNRSFHSWDLLNQLVRVVMLVRTSADLIHAWYYAQTAQIFREERGSYLVWFLFIFTLYAFLLFCCCWIFFLFLRKQECNPWVAFSRGKYCAISVSMGMCKLLLWREGPNMLRYARLWQAEISAEEPCQICSLIHALPPFRPWPSPSDKQHRSRPCSLCSLSSLKIHCLKWIYSVAAEVLFTSARISSGSDN